MVILLLRAAAVGCLLLGAACSAAETGRPTSPGVERPSASPAGPSASQPTAPLPGVLLAPGDSVAFGLGAPAPARDGYVPLLADRLPGPGLDVRNLAVPGATTQSMVRSQVPRALAALEDRDVRLVTVTIGGNDVFGPVLQACGEDPAGAGCRSVVRSSLAWSPRGSRRG